MNQAERAAISSISRRPDTALQKRTIVLFSRREQRPPDA